MGKKVPKGDCQNCSMSLGKRERNNFMEQEKKISLNIEHILFVFPQHTTKIKSESTKGIKI